MPSELDAPNGFDAMNPLPDNFDMDMTLPSEGLPRDWPGVSQDSPLQDLQLNIDTFSGSHHAEPLQGQESINAVGSNHPFPEVHSKSLATFTKYLNKSLVSF